MSAIQESIVRLRCDGQQGECTQSFRHRGDGSSRAARREASREGWRYAIDPDRGLYMDLCPSCAAGRPQDKEAA